MRRFAPALAAACLLAICAAAGPALSLAGWRSEPVEFELAPAPSAGTAKPREFVSRPLRTGKRFNLVGLRWRGGAEPAVAIRARRGDGRWTRWAGLSAHGEDGPDPGTAESARFTSSSPVWVGEADQVQYRIARRVPGLRLHFVNSRGTATRADRALAAVRSVASSVATDVDNVLGGGEAGAQEAQPPVVEREEWGGNSCQPRSAPRYGVVKAAHVHHTVSLNNYSREEAPDVVLGICRYHRNSNGWDDIGYNFLVDKYGTLYEGRAGGMNRAVVGAQAQGYNAQTTGISNIGTFTSVPQSPAALQAMARLIRWKLPVHGAPTSGSVTLTSAGGGTNRHGSGARVRVQRVLGHRDTNSTACPGDALYGQLPQLRRMVAGAAIPTGADTALSVRPPRRSVRYAGRVRVTGRLRTIDGDPLARKPLKVQVRRGRRWRTVSRVRTGLDGRFLAILRPRGSRFVRARFAGDAGFAPTTSRRAFLSVRPLITVVSPPRSGARGERVRLRGRVRPSKRFLYLVLERGSGRRFVKLGTRRVRTRRRGRFSTSFVPADRGRYRFRLVARRDRRTARGRSKAHVLRVGGRPAREAGRRR